MELSVLFTGAFNAAFFVRFGRVDTKMRRNLLALAIYGIICNITTVEGRGGTCYVFLGEML